MESKQKVVRFTELEKSFLLLLLEKYRKIVENKETDGVSLQQKKKCWNEIAAEFNREPEHSKRTVSQLQKCWDNVKTKRRKMLADEKRARMATGGGSVPIKSDKDEGILDRLILNATDIEIPDSIDSDTTMLNSGAAAYQPKDDLLTVANTTSSNFKNNAEIDEPSTSKEVFFTGSLEEEFDGTEAVLENTIAVESSTSKSALEKLKKCTQGSSKLKKKYLTARQGAINLEVRERLNRLARRDEEDAELFAIKKDIALQNLKEAQIKVETAKQVQQYEKELFEIKKRKLLNDS